MKKKDVINIIKSFIDGTGGEWDWDDFISILIKSDPFLEEIRKKCAGLPDEFPPAKKSQYCNEDGIKVLEGLIRLLEERVKQEESEKQKDKGRENRKNK